MVLKGITWNHSRGITPLQAASQRFSELHPDVEVQWYKRSLQHFADYPIEELTKEYDLLIIDHPWVGTAAATNCVLPLDEWLPQAYLQDQLKNSVGYSCQSYNYNGHQWALAIDAATPAASYRKDLLNKNGVGVPQTWDDVLDLAKLGKIAAPAIPIDLLMNFYTFCIAHGSEPFTLEHRIVDESAGLLALESMKEFYGVIDKSMFSKNPIAVAEVMTQTDDFWYCPFAYCYSNYSRTGYAQHLLTYDDVATFNGSKLRTTIGGTGLSVSAFSKYKNEALAFAEMVCSSKFQSNGYTLNEGQPGHLKAWESDFNNQLTHNFFRNLLPVMKNGYLRPRYRGYLQFQDEAGAFVQEYMTDKHANARSILEQINRCYLQSLDILNQKIE